MIWNKKIARKLERFRKRLLFNCMKNDVKVADKYIMTNKDVGFVHLDANVVEKAMEALEGHPFNGGNLKIEYGQIGRVATVFFSCVSIVIS